MSYDLGGRWVSGSGGMPRKWPPVRCPAGVFTSFGDFGRSVLWAGFIARLQAGRLT